MRIASGRRDDDFEISVIPLIDVMLTLLMFFVLSTTFVEHSRMKVTLPEAETTDRRQDEQPPLLIVIDREGRYYLDNNEVLNSSLDTLKEAIARVAGDDRQRPVSLRADAQTPHQAVITAMDALGSLGFTHLSIATTPAERSGTP